MSPNESPVKTIGVSGVAQILNCSPKTVLEKAGLGEIPGAKIGKSWVFKLSDIHKYFNDEIERQTLARKNRYIAPPSTGRAYEQPSQKQAYPDLSRYRSQPKP